MTHTVGRSEGRLEDRPLITGAGRYTADTHFPDELALVLVRSSMAAGRIVSIETEAARKAPGVHAVLTAADLPPEIGVLTPNLLHPAPDGGDMFVPPYSLLARDTVRYVGDIVAAVVADNRAAGENAADLIELDIDLAEPVVDPLQAKANGSPSVWPECPDNICFSVNKGDRTAAEAAIDRAAHVVRQRLVISRVTAAPIEVRSALGRFHAAEDRYELHVGTQAAHRLGQSVAEVLGVAPDRIRVVSGDTGGSFGMKNTAYPEYPLVLFASRLTGRPVRWEPWRSESLLADSHSREQVVDATLGLDTDGHFLGITVDVVANIGAYLGPMSTHPMVQNLGSLAGVYRTPAIAATVEGVFTNTQNMAPYRGAGRPEATYAIERLADLAAARLGIDRAEIRRRNMIRPEEMPFKTGLLFTYDSGDFPAVMDAALKRADWAGFETRRSTSAKRGLLRGIGISNPIEIAGGPQDKPNPEYARLAVDTDGTVTLTLGSGDSGQGHRTTYAGLIGDRLAIPSEEIRFIVGDTGAVARGTGTFGSRTSSAAGTALMRAFDLLVQKARAGAAKELEVAAEDLEFAQGAFTVAGTDRRITLIDVARASDETLVADNFSSADGGNFPNGCHVCEVEVDPETGQTAILRYTVVDDVGTVLNHALVEGQIHGGVAQGVGQALMEWMVYDSSGQPLTGSFQDYGMPRATEFPMFDVASHPVPTTKNVLGVKGAGEAGAVGALPAFVSAVMDALRPLGILHLDMPLTPCRIWRAIDDQRDYPGQRADLLDVTGRTPAG